MNVTLPLLQPLAVKSRLFVPVIVTTLAICIFIIEALPTSAFGEPQGGRQPNKKEEPPSVVHPVDDAVLQTSTRDYTQSMRALRKCSKGRSMSMSLSMTMDPSPPARVDGCTVRVRS